MFGSTVLEVAVGLTFCYASVALIVSTVQEALAAALRLRPRCLLDGIKSMLNDPHLTALAGAIYSHALVNPHASPGLVDARSTRAKPAFIEPAHFAIALIDAIQSIPGDYAQLGRDIDALSDPQIKRALQGIYQRAGGDMQAFELAVSGWFDTAMERVSAAYKRRAMMISLALSLLLAVLFNIDSIHLFRTLWQHPALAAQITAAPASVDGQAMEALWRLPIGWDSFPPRFNDAFALNVAGWMLTASTALFGAPFWFNLMKKTVEVRGAAKP
ncbi:hypothetical protein [Massilia sp. TSP1-1-2]|uniref:hypothetical protein n=1 Tax=unclassified Massilia TaxID=2609279 RepID=UPI003CF5678D